MWLKQGQVHESQSKQPQQTNKRKEGKFFFCALKTEGTTCERRSCLLFRVTKEAIEGEARSHMPQAFEKDFCNWERTGTSMGRRFFS